MKISLLGSLAVVLMAITGLPGNTILITAGAPVDVVSGHGWSYAVDYKVHNKERIAGLIQCESEGVNIVRPDSNGLLSWGILQYNGTSTWADFSTRFHFKGSTLMTSDAIHMADLAIDAGLGYRWTCWQNLLIASVPISIAPVLFKLQ